MNEEIYIPLNYRKDRVEVIDNISYNVYIAPTYEMVLEETDKYACSPKYLNKFKLTGQDPLKPVKCYMCKETKPAALFPLSTINRQYVCRACNKFDPDKSRKIKFKIEELLEKNRLKEVLLRRKTVN